MDNTFDSMYYGCGESIGGVDESGVVDIAGPLVAACVILPRISLQDTDLRIFEVNDCKEMPEKYRKRYAEIIWQTAVAIGIGEVSPPEVDYFGMGIAIKLALTRAVVACRSTTDKKTCIPDYLMIDGGPVNKLNLGIKQMVVPKGDSKSLSIACASVVAKVYRDEIMYKLAKTYPYYRWEKNKGHGSEAQLSGMDYHGVVLGVHRLKNKSKDDRKRMWKDITAKRTFHALEEELRILKKR